MKKISDKKIEKIMLLLEMAERGDPRPVITTALGAALNNYVYPHSASYDAVFASEIRKLRPDWFGRKPYSQYKPRAGKNMTPEQAKDALIKLALDRQPLEVTVRLYRHFRHFTEVENIRTYDHRFTKLIALLAPDWFRKDRVTAVISDAETNKRALLLVAEAGWDKPSRKTKLGQVLSTYISPGHRSYDAAFSHSMVRQRPEWFGYQPIQMAKAA